MTRRYDYSDVSVATVTPMTEEQLAAQRVREGLKVVLSHGRYWLRISPGLYDGIHWLSRRDPEEIRRPTLLCWGFRGALSDDHASEASGSIPIHLLRDLKDFDLEHVPSKEIRHHLRAFWKQDVRIVHVNSPEVLRDQGYEVFCSWLSRTEHRSPDSKAHYLGAIERTLQNPGTLVLAGMAGDRLLGYSTQWAVDRTAYLHELVVSTEALDMHLSAAINHECIQVFRRTGLIDEICPGLHMPDKGGLSTFKARQGFELTHVPCLVHMNSLAATFIRRRYPDKFYRFTGQEPAS